MKRVKAKEDIKNFGRFGRVSKSDVLEVTNAEFYCVSKDKRFEVVSSLEGIRKIQLSGAKSYDLRFVDWSLLKLNQWLSSRSRKTLLAICQGMNECGADIQIFSTHKKEEIVSMIEDHATASGWVNIARDARLASPKLPSDKSPVSFEEEVKDEKKAAKKTTTTRKRKKPSRARISKNENKQSDSK